MKKIFSLATIIQKMSLVVKRFPVSVAFVAGFCVLLFISINHSQNDIPFVYWLFFGIGAFISTAATLLLENLNLKTLWQHVINFAAICLWWLYCYFLPREIDDIYADKGIQIIVIGIAAFLAIFFISFLKKNKDASFWNFSTQTVFQLIVAAFFGGIFYGGLSLALLAIDSLFAVKVDYKIYANLAVICNAFFSPIYFLANIPDKIAKHEDTLTATKFLKIFALYILTPILTVYAAILYAYLFKIIIAWELPNGWVSWLVSVLALGGLFVITLIFPLYKLRINRFAIFISRFSGLIIFPLLLLMTIGIVRRISDYGITINRLYILVLNCWFYMIYAYLFLTKSLHVKWVLISAVAIGVMVSVGFWSISNVTKMALTKEIKTALGDQKLSQNNAAAIFEKMESKSLQRLKSDIEYLTKNYGKQSIQPFLNDTIGNKSTWKILKDLQIDSFIIDSVIVEEVENTWFYYIADKNTQTYDIKNYTNFVQLSCRKKEKDTQTNVNYQVLKDEVVVRIVDKNLTVKIPVKDIAAKYWQNEDKNKEIINIKEDNYLLIINSLYGDYHYDNNTFDFDNFEAYLFY